MAYNDTLAQRLRECLASTPHLVEKRMFGGIAFMVEEVMCVGVHGDEMILRCVPEQTEALTQKKGVRLFDLSGKPMKSGWLLVDVEVLQTTTALYAWVKYALEANKILKATQKKSKK